MQLVDSPDKLVLPFAADGGKNVIPVNSQIGIVAGAASLTDGFPPLTRTPKTAGGIGPSGLDMNGILFDLSSVVRWANAGGGYIYDSVFAANSNVGGYPKGARIARTDGKGYWLNLTDNNSQDPETSGAAAAGWVPDFTNGVSTITMTSSNVTLNPLQYGKPIILITGLLTTNLNLVFPSIAGQWAIINNTTGAFTITCKTASGAGATVDVFGLIVSDGTEIHTTEAPAQTASGSIQGAFKNLKASATGSSANISVSADEIVVESSDNNYQTLRSVSLSSISGASSGVANGLDTGSLAINSWYSIWVIWNGITTAGLLSLSATAPTLPSGYTHKARVGWMRTDSSGNKFPLAFWQAGRNVQYRVTSGSNVAALPLITSGAMGSITTPTYVSTGVSGFVPPTASIIKLQLNTYTGGSQGMIVSPNASYGPAAVGGTNPPFFYCQTNTSISCDSAEVGEMLLESSNIFVASSNANLFVLGWKDNL